VRLRWYDDAGRLRFESIREGVNIVGRSPTCDVRIDDRTVSRRHAKLVRAGRRIWVEDLESSNGTYLNGKPTRCASLAPGDVLCFGKLTVRIVVGKELSFERTNDETDP
jgi:pSer/pThr/pTyr-binding forkhead associated (FHA) protein